MDQATVLVAKPGQEPERCLDTPEALRYARTLGFRPVVVAPPRIDDLPENEVYVTRDGGRTLERCLRDKLQYARSLGFSLATPAALERHGAKKKEPDGPAVVRPNPVLTAGAPQQASTKKR